MRGFAVLVLFVLLSVMAQVSAQGLEFFDVDEYNKESKQKQQQQTQAAPVTSAAAPVESVQASTANAALAGAELDLSAAADSATSDTSNGEKKKKKKKKTAQVEEGSAIVIDSTLATGTNTNSTAPSTAGTNGNKNAASPADAAASSSTPTSSVDFLDLSAKSKTNNTVGTTVSATTASTSKASTTSGASAVQFMDLQQSGTTTADKPKVVLITGITGLMGSNVARELVKDSNKQRYKVYGMIRQRSSLDLLSGIIQSVHLILGDVTDSFRMLDVIQAVKPDIVYHFAAQSANALSFEHPQLTMSINVHGTLNLLEALRRADLVNTRIFFPSSSSAYGNSGKLFSTGIPEIAKLDPISPYGLSKATAEEIVLQYNRNYAMPVRRIFDFVLFTVALSFSLFHV